ncbi:uncharacterized protein LOC108024115 [Drosophila biarmipes]|uniref:uncharacterized protein LOC108024115 n=1 Tax=Drosophila biarmipes TaxID=125945 RepID=UPI0007E8154C|nr:uncharacterized protein LOC108024115 [Drosophila biarmipes]
MKGEKIVDDEREHEKPGLSNGSMRSQRGDAEPIDKKLKEIKDQKAHFNEMVGSLESLVTPVNSKTLTKSMKKGDAPEKKNLIVDKLPFSSGPKISPSASAEAKAEATEEIAIDPVANMFVMQPDGTHECYAGEVPVAESQQVPAMREIRIDDGERIILTGGNGQVVYHPEDTVAIDIDDARVFVFDAQESGVSFVQATESSEVLDIDSIIEFLPEEQDTTAMGTDGGVQSATYADGTDMAQFPTSVVIQVNPEQARPIEGQITQPPAACHEMPDGLGLGEDDKGVHSPACHSGMRN